MCVIYWEGKVKSECVCVCFYVGKNGVGMGMGPVFEKNASGCCRMGDFHSGFDLEY